MSTGNIQCLPELNLDIRVMIWKQSYEIEPPRIVEIDTEKHGNCNEHTKSWCPRYSPSPPPAIVNVCHETRYEAQRLAKIKGHLLFFSSQPNLPPIYFNPAKDTLYVRNSKEYWIRDWWGGNGILTQLKLSWQPELLRFLAIELDPINRATRRGTFEGDLKDFQNLDLAIYVVAKQDEKMTHLVQWRSHSPWLVNRKLEFLERHCGVIKPSGWISRVKECKLAVRRGACFDFVASYDCKLE